jgi:thiol-disulfide isomerase/thioredoxin
VKKNILFFLVIALAYGANAQGVNWHREGNLRSVFDKAKAQNKPVFIEAYSPECHVCQAFKPTFSQKIVGDLYNKYFISYQLDVDTEEAHGFFGKQNIWLPSIPTLLFFDKNVNLQHIAVMSETRNNATVLNEAAKIALDAKSRTSNYNTRFAAGDRSPNFLIEHALMARYQKDTSSNFAAVQAYFKTQKPTELANSTNILVLEKAVIDMDTDFFNHLINNLPKYYSIKEKAKVNTIAENILMYSLYSSKGNKWNSAKIAKVKLLLSKVGIDAKSIAGRVWMQEAIALFREKQPQKAISIMENRVKGMKVSRDEGQYLCRFVKMHTADKVALASAEKWCKL